MKRRKLLLTCCTIVVVAGLGSCGSDPVRPAATPVTVKGIQLLKAAEQPIADTFEAPGTVHARRTAPLAAQIMGSITAVNVHEGDRVRQGQALVLIDDAQPRAAVDQAQSALAAAEHELAATEAEFTMTQATYRRYQSLLEKKSVSPQEFEEIRSRSQAAGARRDAAIASRNQAAAALDQAKTVVTRTVIRAPFDGVVTERRVDPGALASPGEVLLSVEGGGGFRLEVTVDEGDLRYVRRGKVPVAIDSVPDALRAGTVEEIVPAADPASRTFTVKIGLPSDSHLKSGMFGRAWFSRGTRSTVVVPQSSVVEHGQLQAVYVVGSDQVANLRYVTVGRPVGKDVEVLSGVNGGELLVAAPAGRELGGKRVEERP